MIGLPNRWTGQYLNLHVHNINIYIYIHNISCTYVYTYHEQHRRPSTIESIDRLPTVSPTFFVFFESYNCLILCRSHTPAKGTTSRRWPWRTNPNKPRNVECDAIERVLIGSAQSVFVTAVSPGRVAFLGRAGGCAFSQRLVLGWD